MAPTTGFPLFMTDLFGLEVSEFDPLPADSDNHMNSKGNFHISHLHPVRVWADVIEPRECQILATYAKDFYAGRPVLTMNPFGLGRAIYLGTMSQPAFYFRPHRLAARPLQPRSLAEGAGRRGSEPATKGRLARCISCSITGGSRSPQPAQAHA
jgi:beta-galactosidase GanA